MSGNSPTQLVPTIPGQPRWRSLVSQLLRNERIAQIKRTGRDALWTVRGTGITNGPVPAEIASILFVCQGNICRSPFAAHRAALTAAERGLMYLRCSSAGIAVKPSDRPPAESLSAGRNFGVDLDGHQPQQLTEALVHSQSLILVMEAVQLRQLHAHYPQARRRIQLLPLFSPAGGRGYRRYNIQDPFGSPESAFHAVYGQIDRCVNALFDRLSAHGIVT